ncbi:MAG TPA: DUF3891 family protein [Candidatus Aquilonibacter sp.]|nr:DUF3891 family protein [Candidatus Aquilonibacter sp.]
MLRLETETGWWLVTHPDHARLAGAFAQSWGNEAFPAPEPRERVLKGISRHDDGWLTRDAAPEITRQGKPSAFSVELVGKYSAFEEIDLADYLAVRGRALRLIAEEDPYAAILVSMHTYSLLTDHADRTTIARSQLPLLDEFLKEQTRFQQTLRRRIAEDRSIDDEQKSETAIRDRFRLLQAADNLSLLTCVDFAPPANLLHPLPLRNGGYSRVEVTHAGARHFKLSPYPFAQSPVMFSFPSRHVEGKIFSTREDLRERFASAPVQTLTVTVSAG